VQRGQLPIPAALILAAALSAPAAAERESYSFVSYAGSDVSLLSSAADEETARINTPVLSGDRIVTGPASRAEVVLASGNVVRIDAKTEVRFDRMSRTYESDDDRDLLYLPHGDAAVETRDPEAGDWALRLDTDDATIVVERHGLIRVDAGRRGTEVYVLAGEAEVAGRSGSIVLREGEYAFIRGTDEIEVGNADPPRDTFTRFVDERHSRRPPGEATTWIGSNYDYESSLAGFDENGSWVYVSSYDRWGWRPAVSADWRPYSLGYWRWTPCGLTWVSYEPWGWLPYHFGTWCREALYGWVWMPGSAYAPAWVYWSYTPAWVGWCPTGYYGTWGSRSTRTRYGVTGGFFPVPYFRGRVDLARVDPHGWNYAPSHRIGRHLDPLRDIVRGERLPLRSGDTAIVSTAPLRIDRGAAPAPVAVRDAIRRVAESAGPRSTLPVSEGLTALLRRDPNLTEAAEQELRRSIAPLRRDETLRPVTPDAVLSPRKGTRGAGSSAPRRQPALDNGWRSPASPAPRDVRPRRTETAVPTDTGWRAPRRESSTRTAPPVAAPSRPERVAPHVAAPAPAPAPHVAPAPAPHVAPHVAPAAPRSEPPKQR
jgi:hypothetical protein